MTLKRRRVTDRTLILWTYAGNFRDFWFFHSSCVMRLWVNRKSLVSARQWRRKREKRSWWLWLWLWWSTTCIAYVCPFVPFVNRATRESLSIFQFIGVWFGGHICTSSKSFDRKKYKSSSFRCVCCLLVVSFLLTLNILRLWRTLTVINYRRDSAVRFITKKHILSLVDLIIRRASLNCIALCALFWVQQICDESEN